MPLEENNARLVSQWLQKATVDFIVVERLIGDVDPILQPIAFHAQQAVEKYIKAYLVYKQIEFPKTHDIKELINLLATVNHALSQELSDCDVLTVYGVEIRYPGDIPDLTLEEVKQAVELARKVREAILGALPPEFKQ